MSKNTSKISSDTGSSTLRSIVGGHLIGLENIKVSLSISFDIINSEEEIWNISSHIQSYDPPYKCEKFYGLINKRGKEITPIIYDYIYPFYEELAMVNKTHKFGYIDKTGKEVIPCIYDRIYIVSDDLLFAGNEGKFGFIDKTGKKVTQFIYDYNVAKFSEGLIGVQRNGKMGFINSIGEEVIPLKYDFVDDFIDGLAKVRLKSKLELDEKIFKSQSELFIIEFNSCKIGCIDKKGQEVVPLIYDEIGDFFEGLSLVGKDGKKGIIDKTGKEIVPPIYDDIETVFYEGNIRINWTNGFVKVNKNGKAEFIDKNGKEILPVDNIKIEMIFVEGGTFMMGNSEQYGVRYGSEQPVHRETIADFYIGKYQVTQAQWKEVMGMNPSYFKGDNLPVEQVSWDAVQDFIQRLNAKTGKQYRLPTEAEWEYAARGGNKSSGCVYSGSNVAGDVVWCKENSRGTTHPVGTKSPNELGIYDMGGNVIEWCYDCWRENYNATQDCSHRVIRGGCWAYPYTAARVSSRDIYFPNLSWYTIGFRLACSSK